MVSNGVQWCPVKKKDLVDIPKGLTPYQPSEYCIKPEIGINKKMFLQYIHIRHQQQFVMFDESDHSSQSRSCQLAKNDGSSIKSRRFILIYTISKQYVCFRSRLTPIQWEQMLRQTFGQEEIMLNQLHRGLSRTVLDFSFGRRHEISQAKWMVRLIVNDSKPLLLSYDKTYFLSCIRDTQYHFPQRFIDSMQKVKKGEITLADFLDKNPGKISSYSILKSNFSQLQADKKIFHTRSLIYQKQRGVWLYGPANVGKTTLALTKFLEIPYYQKDLTTKTFDDYKGQSSVLVDDLDESSAAAILPLLKTAINVKASRVNIKYGSIEINAKVIVVTSQYLLQSVTKDNALVEAIRARFKFYTVSADKENTYFQQFKEIPGDIQSVLQVVPRGMNSIKECSSEDKKIELQAEIEEEISLIYQARLLLKKSSTNHFES